VRGFVFGILLLAVLTTTILSLRPGGIRRQLRFAARRLRIVLALGGIYVVGSTVIRVAFPSGPVSDYRPRSRWCCSPYSCSWAATQRPPAARRLGRKVSQF
jgi:hypothetical protein